MVQVVQNYGMTQWSWGSGALGPLTSVASEAPELYIAHPGPAGSGAPAGGERRGGGAAGARGREPGGPGGAADHRPHGRHLQEDRLRVAPAPVPAGAPSCCHPGRVRKASGLASSALRGELTCCHLSLRALGDWSLTAMSRTPLGPCWAHPPARHRPSCLEKDSCHAAGQQCEVKEGRPQPAVGWESFLDLTSMQHSCKAGRQRLR